MDPQEVDTVVVGAGERASQIVISTQSTLIRYPKQVYLA
jgi:hypothetical protein